ncbi:prolipoprotein diacylglyceryl transferase [Fimbriimonas ginsengisoli]|uniref:Phosphatidylglycerol--prolipoprotein diacylglyceryl transferase n=1 Tax=Fimbriimonas ginsengisoli Gsoil 348 TaxID=661478 RepID=A0A068NUQ8_FIMGI|nr:prolipoprotein diacylglyceryl transferase [Fimbriimonas ginsengisoli]AIE87062.1 Prolipoprotein diacylglyceryl transferase [Fimbriimonas ginsengisoli Gsoil 348]
MLPILFHIGKFPVRSYGISILVAFLSGLWLVRKRAEKFGFDKQKVTDLCFYLLIIGILGARILFLVQDIPYYSKHLNEVFSLTFAGLTSFGALITGGAYVIYWAKKHHARLGNLCDLLAPGFMLAHVFGRIGCFLNGCCYGGVCDASVPWATHFEGVVGLHHPAQLYDSLMNLVGLGLLLLYERKGFRPGQVTGMFLILHGLTRFIYEFWRAGTDQEVQTGLASSTYWTKIGSLQITQAQGVALAMIVGGVVLWFLAGRRQVSPQDPTELEPKSDVAPEMQAA